MPDKSKWKRKYKGGEGANAHLRFPPPGTPAPEPVVHMRPDMIAAFVGNTAHPPRHKRY